MEKLQFDDWAKDRFEHFPSKKGEFYIRYPYNVSEVDTLPKLPLNEVVDEYLDYFQSQGKIGENVTDLQLNELKKRIWFFDEEIVAELDTGEVSHFHAVGNLMNTNICELYGTINIPTNPNKEYEGSLMNIHPQILEVLTAWWVNALPLFNFDTGSEEDFWECFVNINEL